MMNYEKREIHERGAKSAEPFNARGARGMQAPDSGKRIERGRRGEEAREARRGRWGSRGGLAWLWAGEAGSEGVVVALEGVGVGEEFVVAGD